MEHIAQHLGLRDGWVTNKEDIDITVKKKYIQFVTSYVCPAAPKLLQESLNNNTCKEAPHSQMQAIIVL